MSISDWSSDVCSSGLVSGWSGPEPAAASRNDGGCTRAAARSWRHWPLQCRQVVDSGLAACSGAGAESSRMTTVESGCSRLDPRAEPAMRERPPGPVPARLTWIKRSEEHTSELQSLMRISYAVFCLKKQNNKNEPHANATD